MISSKCICIALCVLAFCPVYGIREGKFYAGVLCDLETRMSRKCSHQVSGVKTKNACVFGCSKDPECIGTSIEDKHMCFHHYVCTDVSGCGTQEHEHEYLAKNCAHGGVWNPKTLDCVCANGWVGENCLNLPSKCMDLVNHGGYPRGMHRTYLNLGSPTDFDTSLASNVCWVNPETGWTQVTLLSNSGGGNFGNRTWDEYKNGFYVDSSNFWVGLERWHALSMAGYHTFTVYINVATQYRQYRQFVVKDASKNYSFTFRRSFTLSRSGQIDNVFPDCFGPLQNFPFSTKDNDNDGVPSDNCADRVGSGWWFAQSCSSKCNFLGVSPKDWSRYPDEKWLRVDGTDPQSIKDAYNFKVHGYLR